jgi:hypothetical protein
MISIRKLVGVLCLASLCSHYSNAQVLDPTQEYTTGNIVLPTIAGSGTTPWVNGVYQDSLTCWSWGDPGYCGPNAIVRPGGSINFSYGTTDLYQSQAIASVLPNSGTGLKVNGYTFSFMAKNGNHWDDARTDYLNAYVHFTNSNGSVVEYDSYNLNYKFNWTNFNFSKNFTSPYSASTLGNVTYGFVGRDNNGWAGPYGPEIYGVNFSLRYSVDQCALNPLYSTTCPGYAEAYKSYQCSINPLYDSTCTGYATAYLQQQCTINPLYDQSCPGYAQAYLQQQCNANPLYSFQCSGYGAAMAAQLDQKKQQSSSQESSTPHQQTITAVIEDTTKEPTRVDLGGVETTSTGALVIPDGIPQVVKESATEEKKSAAAPSSLIMSLLRDQREKENRAALETASKAERESRSENANPSDGIGLNPFSGGVGLQATLNIGMPSQDDSKQENTKLSNANNLTTGIDQKQQNISNESERQTQAVKRKVEPNEMDSVTTIAALTQSPLGFDAYLRGQIQDGNLYAPKEIYKNQKVIDNRRAERILNMQSDARYEEMVNKQYEKNEK